MGTVPPVDSHAVNDAAECAPHFSVVIPFYNEAGNLDAVLTEIRHALESLHRPYEVLAVNDGSNDGTAERLQLRTQGWPELQVFQHEQNLGQAAALWTGFRAARGAWLIMLDGDGQNVPADIPALVRLTEAGADLAVGVRSARQDSWLRRRMSELANRVRRRVLRDGVSDGGCALKIFRRELLNEMRPVWTLNALLPAMAAAAGFRVVECAVQHRARVAGKSNYGLGNMAWRPAVDMIGLWWWRRRRLPRA